MGLAEGKKNALFALLIIAGLGTFIAYLGASIAAGITDLSLAFKTVFSSAGFLLALGMGGVAVYVFATRLKGIAITKKELPLLSIVGFAIIFLTLGTKLFSVIPGISIPVLGLFDLVDAMVFGAIGFAVGLYCFKLAKKTDF